MANLVECSLCKRRVSNECRSCPNCGHNVADELYQKEMDRGNNLLKKNICPKCNSSNNWTKYLFSTPRRGYEFIESDMYSRQCAKCGWKDLHYRETASGFISGQSRYYIK